MTAITDNSDHDNRPSTSLVQECNIIPSHARRPQQQHISESPLSSSTMPSSIPPDINIVRSRKQTQWLARGVSRHCSPSRSSSDSEFRQDGRCYHQNTYRQCDSMITTGDKHHRQTQDQEQSLMLATVRSPVESNILSYDARWADPWLFYYRVLMDRMLPRNNRVRRASIV